MSAREERHCEMMMAQDDAAQTSPDRPLLCVRMCVAFRVRDRVFPRAKYIKREIYIRERNFSSFGSRLVPRRDVLVLVPVLDKAPRTHVGSI